LICLIQFEDTLGQVKGVLAFPRFIASR